MRSQLVERLGAQEPQILHSPPGVVSLAAAEETIELADSYGVCDGFPLAESQKITLRNGLGERAGGSWAATRIADFGPRQGTGKNDKIAARELAGLILFGERLIIHTAHEFPTANESFLRLVSVFENWDDLRKRVDHIYYANGAQAINLLSGQRLLYKARTGGSGRGFAKADLLVYDEAQHLAREHVRASGPTKMANPNSQTWYAGSGGLATSAVAWEIRRAALFGTGGRLAYTEMTGETVSLHGDQIQSVVPDPLDRDVWYRCIPGLGRWVTEEAVEDQYKELGAEGFLREILCVWDPEPNSGGMVIPAELWKACEDPASSFVGAPVVTVDVTPDRSRASIAAAALREDGLPHVEVIQNAPGTEWVVPKLLALSTRPRRILVVGSDPAGSLIAAGQAAGLTIEAVSTADHAKACGLLFDLVAQGGMRHRVDPLLDAALAGAVRRDMGDGAWLWSRKNSLVDISPLVASTIALWAASEVPVNVSFEWV